MDLNKTGKFLKKLRLKMGYTQKDLAEKLGVVPKTVSKWETGKGFPDVSLIASLSDVLNVDLKTLVLGEAEKGQEENGNMKRLKFYICPVCGGMLKGTGSGNVSCCGEKLQPIKPLPAENEHIPCIEEIENDYYVTFNHQMTKEHYISFVTFVGFDRELTVRLYPEQEAAVRLPRIARGKLIFCCNKHGLFEVKI